MKSKWSIWVNANKETGAQKLLNRVLKRMGIEASEIQIDPYHKGGFKVSFEVTHDENKWSDLVIECIALGQKTAHGWGLYGDILHDPGASSDQTNVAGVDLIEWRLMKNENIKDLRYPHALRGLWLRCRSATTGKHGRYVF